MYYIVLDFSLDMPPWTLLPNDTIELSCKERIILSTLLVKSKSKRSLMTDVTIISRRNLQQPPATQKTMQQ